MAAYHYVNGKNKIKETSLSTKSMKAIYKEVTGGDLSNSVAKAVARDMSKEVFEMLEAVKSYVIHNRSNVVTRADIYHALMDDEKELLENLTAEECEEFGALGGEHAAACADNPPSSPEKAPETDSDDESSEGKWNDWKDVKPQEPSKRFPLTREQQDFYQKIIHACWGDDEDVLAAALKTLEADPSLEFILPRLITHIVDKIDEGLYEKDLYQCIVSLRMAQALVQNRILSLEKHFHVILPAVLSCLLIQEEFEQDDKESSEFQWDLRELASQVMGDIVRVAKSFNTLGKVVKILISGLRRQENLLTIYGAVIGFGQLGSLVVEDYLLPEIYRLSELMYAGGRNPRVEEGVLKNIWYRLIQLCSPVLKTVRAPPDEMDEYVALYGHFGEYLYYMVCGIRIKEDERANSLAAQLQLEAEQKFELEKKVVEELFLNFEAQKESTVELLANLEEKRISDIKKVAEKELPEAKENSDCEENGAESKLIATLDLMETEVAVDCEEYDAGEELIQRLEALKNDDVQEDVDEPVDHEEVYNDDLMDELFIMLMSDSEGEGKQNKDTGEAKDEAETTTENPDTNEAKLADQEEDYDIDEMIWEVPNNNSSSTEELSDVEEDEYSSDEYPDPYPDEYFTDDQLED